MERYKLKRNTDDFYDLAAVIARKANPSLADNDDVFKEIKNDLSFRLISRFLNEFTTEGAKSKEVAVAAKKGHKFFSTILDSIITQIAIDDYTSVLNDFSSQYGVLVTSKLSKIDENEAPSVFISHTSVDKEFVRKLSNILASEGIRVWLDEVDLRLGEPLLQKIETAIEEMDFLIAILSVNSINSNWVKKELEMANTLELETGQNKILPIIIDSCTPPLSLRGKLYLDFSVPIVFQANCEKLLSIIKKKDYPIFLTAREAARMIPAEVRGTGDITAISQRGINQKYNSFTDREDWHVADVKTGRSRVWVFEFIDKNRNQLRPFSVKDSRLIEHPVVYLTEESIKKEKRLNFIFIDSDIAVNKAIKMAVKNRSINDNSVEYIILTDLKYFEALKEFVWNIVFYDVVLGKPIEVVFINAKNGNIAS